MYPAFPLGSRTRDDLPRCPADDRLRYAAGRSRSRADRQVLCYVRAPEETPLEVVAYTRVSSSDQRSNLDRRKVRLLEHAQPEDLCLAAIVTETSSGFDGTCPGLLKVLSPPQLGYVLVEHRERLARLGFEMFDALLRARVGGVLVVEDREVDDDLVRYITEVLTSLCARLHGRQSAHRRADRALAAASQ